MPKYLIREMSCGAHTNIQAASMKDAIACAQSWASHIDWTGAKTIDQGGVSKIALHVRRDVMWPWDPCEKEDILVDANPAASKLKEENKMKNFKIWDARNEHVAYLEAEDVEAAKDKASAWANKIHWGPGVQFVALYVGELDPNDTDVVISKTLITVFFDSSLENETDRVPEEDGEDDDVPARPKSSLSHAREVRIGEHVLIDHTLETLCDLVKELHRHIEAMNRQGLSDKPSSIVLSHLRIARLMDTITDIAQRHTGGPKRINVDLSPKATADQAEIVASGSGDQDPEETAGSSLSG